MALLIEETHHLQLFKHQRGPLFEHHVALRLAAGDSIAQFHRSDLLAGDRRIGGILGQPQAALNAAGFRPTDITGYIFYIRIVERLYHDLMVGPKHLEYRIYRADLFGQNRRRQQQRSE